mmetsp:Transcript_22972/g.63941  ORF Transcript_22972/g.63941 Transcript_22972/m.63941 type:complete len:330 (+) Transcript_22972:164-1153(+)|eukprot:CAMPEP_0168757820 /NCGR_PEP_ID=MMETSP0724-20121128/21372_1 /TAXON_ID=265536 /ORGANISM="Amphiprora sp., Strain CCMP467" /LENGTH=329 /DNA_ID=CAMNT_0008806659 /DNA_START=85 /DNA_END=1074 /DNA_ORIENTATION=+
MSDHDRHGEPQYDRHQHQNHTKKGEELFWLQVHSTFNKKPETESKSRTQRLTMGIILSKQDEAEDCMRAGRLVSSDPKPFFRCNTNKSSDAAATRLRISSGLAILRGHYDDVLSKGTDSTQNSPEPIEPAMATRVRAQINQRETSPHARGIGSSSSTRGGIWYHVGGISADGPEEPKLAQHKIHVKISKPTSRRGVSAPLPVNKDRKQSSLEIPHEKMQSHLPSSHALMDQEDNDHLQTMYDMRTWDMYIRITEARKQRATSCPGPTTTASDSPDADEQQDMADSSYLPLPPSQIEYGYFSRADDMDSPALVPVEVGGSGHEMFFGDLE